MFHRQVYHWLFIFLSGLSGVVNYIIGLLARPLVPGALQYMEACSFFYSSGG